MKKKKLFIVMFPLFIGIAIYIIYRSKTLFYFKLIETQSFLHNPIISLREVGWRYRFYLPLWVVYSLPDGLWLFSLGAALLIDRVYFNIHCVIFTIIYLIMVIFEYIQKFFGGHGTFIGTYDEMDILFFTFGYIFAVSIAFFLNKKYPISGDFKNSITLKYELYKTAILTLLFFFLAGLPTII